MSRSQTQGNTRSQRSGLRCAIYTRKSTEEGLEQAFNSLDAQREACAAYVMSQAGEGWTLVPTAYNDGGWSGGNLERPALQRLLADIEAGLIDSIVVYKIDRLTRSLADFARIVERLDSRGASFVSVTQAFNTTTSMGRLTLNVLLSFAQFEREVGAERVRDKIAASRKKGMWMGGCPPLGYDVVDRKLVINATEAVTISWIFTRYLELRSLARLRVEIEAAGIRTKTFTARTGRQIGGQRWWVGALRHLLRNRVYVGEAVHKTNAYPGEHQALLDRDLFDRVQAALADGVTTRRQKTVRTSAGLLTGLVFDDAGHRMSPQASKRQGGRSYVYYVSQALLQRREDKGTLSRVSAPTLDRVVATLVDHIAGATGHIQSGAVAIDRTLLRAAVRQVQIGGTRISVQVAWASMGSEFQPTDKRLLPELTERIARVLPEGSAILPADHGWDITLPIALGKTSTAKSISRPGASAWAQPRTRHDHTLIGALAIAHRGVRTMVRGEDAIVHKLAAASGFARNNFRHILRLAWLAPDLQRAILDGRQPPSLAVGTILRVDLPLLWSDQRVAFGLSGA